MAPVKRSYRSPRRERQSARTRGAILDAARALFVARGYAVTTIGAIARKAGVSEPTVYAVLGSKAAMLIALLDRMALEADLPRFRNALAAAGGDARRQLREALEFTGRFYAAGMDLIDLARTVSGVEPDLASMWRTGEERRHAAVSALVREWARAGLLASGVSPRTATDLFWAMAGPDVFRLLVVERGWTGRRRVDRLAATLEEALLA